MLPSLVHEPQRVAAEDSRQRRIFRPLICREMRQARAEPGAGALLQPGLGGVADAALVGVGGQGQPQRVAVPWGVGVARERGLAAVAAHADDDAPAQIRQLAAGLPARVRHGQLPLAGVPFAQLVQDPAGFLAHRVVDLAQRDPVGRGDAQAVVGDDEADAAAARTQQHEADGLFVGVHLAPAGAGRQWIGAGRRHAGRGIRGQRQQRFARVGGDGSGRRAGDGASGAGAVRASRARAASAGGTPSGAPVSRESNRSSS